MESSQFFPHRDRFSRRVAEWLTAVALIAVLCAVAGSAPEAAEEVARARLSERDKADIARIEAYLNGIETLSARFLQVASTGEYAEGRIRIARPGRLRIDYDPPVPVLIVTKGTWLIYYDRQLEQVSRVLLSSTPAGILVREKIALFSDDLTISGFSREANALRLTIVRTEDPLEGSLTLILGDRPMTLRKWTVTDAQGVVTTVSLLGVRFGAPIDDDVFQFRDPTAFRTEEH